MSLGRQRWGNSRESPTLSLLGSSGICRTVCSFDIHARWHSSPSFGVQFQLAAAFQGTQKDDGLAPFLYQLQAEVGTIYITMVISVIIQSYIIQYHTISSCTCDLCSWHMYCLMYMCNMKTREKTLAQNYKHEICFCHKQKGNIYISCACAKGLWCVRNADSTKSLLHNRSHRQKWPPRYIGSEIFTAQVCFAINGDCAIFQVVYRLGPKNCLAISGITLYPTLLYSLIQ